jgi:hypothetical protein
MGGPRVASTSMPKLHTSIDLGHIPGRSAPRVASRAIGACCLSFAGIGIWYSLAYVPRVTSRYVFDANAPYFLRAFWVLTSMALIAYAALFVCGIQLLRLKTGASKILLLVVVFEVSTLIGTVKLGTSDSPKLALSVAQATGVGLGGLSPQLFSLFVIWGPVLALWSHHKIKRVPERRLERNLCPACAYPVGTSPVCTECGNPVASRSAIE